MRLGSLVVCLAIASVASQDATAQAPEIDAREHEARRLFEAGREAYASGAYEAALDLFRRAHELSPRPELLYNIGHSADRLRDNETALTYFERYLEAVPDGAHVTQVEGRVLALRTAIEREQALEAELRRSAATEEQPSEEAVPLRSRWWLWTLVGVVVVGAGLGLALGLRDDDEGPAVAPSDFGGVTRALRW